MKLLLFGLSLLTLCARNLAGQRSHRHSRRDRAMVPEYQSIPPTVLANLTSRCTSGIGSIAECPVQGCGLNGDALLNRAKNRTDTPAPGKVPPMTLDEMRALPQPH